MPVCSNCGGSDFVWAENLRTGTIGRGTLSLRSGGELAFGTRVCRGCGHADLFVKDPTILRQPHTWRPGEFVTIPTPAKAPAPAPPAVPAAAPTPPPPVPTPSAPVATPPPPTSAPAAPGHAGPIEEGPIPATTPPASTSEPSSGEAAKKPSRRRGGKASRATASSAVKD